MLHGAMGFPLRFTPSHPSLTGVWTQRRCRQGQRARNAAHALEQAAPLRAEALRRAPRMLLVQQLVSISALVMLVTTTSD